MYINIYGAELVPSTVILHLSINCLGKNPFGCTLGCDSPESNARPTYCLTLLATSGAYFRSPGPRIGTSFMSLFPRQALILVPLVPGTALILLPCSQEGRRLWPPVTILHPRLTRPWCVSPPTAGESDAMIFHRELARLACVPLTAGGKLL